MFVNTKYFQEAGNTFLKKGRYTDAIKGTKDWTDFWRREQARCQNGYSVGGVKITGKHYFYLNYGYMPVNIVEEDSNVADRVNAFPSFWDGDYEFFWIHDIAEKGISVEDYNKLNLKTEVLDLNGGKNLLWLKGRGKGFSHKIAAIQTWSYHFDRNVKMFMTAQDYEKDIVGEDGLFSKTKSKINFQTENCAWGQNTLINNEDTILGGYTIITQDNLQVKKGKQNSIQGIRRRTPTASSMFRGIRGKYFDIEEGGEFKNLLKTIEVTNRSKSEGRYSFGMIRVWGTGGAEDESFDELFNLFYNPVPYNFLSVKNHYDREEDDYYGKPSACFFPTQWNLLGHYDADGNSNVESAKLELDEDLELIKSNPKSTEMAVSRRLAENPVYPRDTRLIGNDNMFPVQLLKDYLLKLDTIQLNLKHGVINPSEDGGFIFQKDNTVKPINTYPIRKNVDLNGCVTILEPPIQGVPYITVHDGYHNDDEINTTTSVAATYVYKLPNLRSFTYTNAPVAWYIGRPANVEDVNLITCNLARYYNSKIGTERASVHLLSYCKRNNLLSLILDDIDIGLTQYIGKKIRKKSVRKGLALDDTKKELALKYVTPFLLKNITNNYTDEVVKLYQTYCDRGLIEEFILYKSGRNVDRISAFLVFIIYKLQYGDLWKPVDTEDEDKDEDIIDFFNSL